MAKKCPNCNSTRTQYRQLYNKPGESHWQSHYYHCLNCGSMFKSGNFRGKGARPRSEWLGI